MHHNDTDSGHGTVSLSSLTIGVMPYTAQSYTRKKTLSVSVLFQSGTIVKFVGQTVEGAHMLGLIFVIFVFSVTNKGMKERGKVLSDVLIDFYETTKHVVNMILWCVKHSNEIYSLKR